jgi:hypothetical protein
LNEIATHGRGKKQTPAAKWFWLPGVCSKDTADGSFTLVGSSVDVHILSEPKRLQQFGHLLLALGLLLHHFGLHLGIGALHAGHRRQSDIGVDWRNFHGLFLSGFALLTLSAGPGEPLGKTEAAHQEMGI